MGLNIKNPRVHALAREAAERAGISQTSAIEQALELYLRQLDSPENREQRVDALIESMRERLSIQTAPLSTDNLYDTEGLPA